MPSLRGQPESARDEAVEEPSWQPVFLLGAVMCNLIVRCRTANFLCLFEHMAETQKTVQKQAIVMHQVLLMLEKQLFSYVLFIKFPICSVVLQTFTLNVRIEWNFVLLLLLFNKAANI